MSGAPVDPTPPAGGAPEAASAEGPPLLLSPLWLDAVIALAMGGLALALWIGASSYDQGNQPVYGPAAFPRGISALLGVTALLLLGKALLPLVRGGLPPSLVIRRPAAVFASMVLVVGYPLMIESIGYYGATGIWLPVLFWLAGYRRPVGVVLSSAGFLLFSRVVFEQVLGTPMP